MRRKSEGLLGEGRVRLAVVDEVAITTPLDPYLSLRSLAAYSGCSVRWLRDRLTDPHHPLPCYRFPGGKILIKRGEFDSWTARYRQVGRPDVERAVSDVLRSLAR